MEGRPEIRSVYDGVREHEILNSASAISFQVLTALVPLMLVLLALVGFAHLDRVWNDIADQLRPKLSQAAFTVVDDSARNVLGHQQPFWLTAGLALAVWRLSAAMRAVMHALDRIYDAGRERPPVERLRVSIGLAVVDALLVLAALAVLHLGPLLVPVDGLVATVASILVRWSIAAACVLLAIGLTIRHAPAAPQPLSWVSFGALTSVTAWLVASVLFGLYATKIADYGSLFGSFASVFVLLSYVYLATIAMLVGVEVDTQVRRRGDGAPQSAVPLARAA